MWCELWAVTHSACAGAGSSTACSQPPLHSPVPTMTAVGVARPRAQGQAMTRTAMPNSRANRKWVWPGGSQLSGYQPSTPAAYLHGGATGRREPREPWARSRAGRGLVGRTTSLLPSRHRQCAPEGPGQQRQRHHHRHKHGGHPVGKCLDRGLGHLCVSQGRAGWGRAGGQSSGRHLRAGWRAQRRDGTAGSPGGAACRRPRTCAASTSRTICARAVSAPTRATRTRSGPPTFTVPPMTASPGPLDTGTEGRRVAGRGAAWGMWRAVGRPPTDAVAAACSAASNCLPTASHPPT